MADKLPLEIDTVMYGASLTKLAFAYMIMQLVDEKVLTLDRPLAEYLPKPLPEYPEYADLAGDARGKSLTARMISVTRRDSRISAFSTKVGSWTSSLIQEPGMRIREKDSTCCNLCSKWPVPKSRRGNAKARLRSFQNDADQHDMARRV